MRFEREERERSMLTQIILGSVLVSFLLLGVVAYAIVRVGALSDQREFLEEEEEEREKSSS